MASTLARHRATRIHSAAFFKRAKKDLALSRLVDELVVAFFVAMAVMWVVAAIAEAFA
jgi:hypothetical protein